MTAEDGERGGKQWRAMEDCSTDWNCNRKRFVADSGQTSMLCVYDDDDDQWLNQIYVW